MSKKNKITQLKNSLVSWYIKKDFSSKLSKKTEYGIY